jgi:hypothetical protein
MVRAKTKDVALPPQLISNYEKERKLQNRTSSFAITPILTWLWWIESVVLTCVLKFVIWLLSITALDTKTITFFAVRHMITCLVDCSTSPDVFINRYSIANAKRSKTGKCNSACGIRRARRSAGPHFRQPDSNLRASKSCQSGFGPTRGRELTSPYRGKIRISATEKSSRLRSPNIGQGVVLQEGRMRLIEATTLLLVLNEVPISTHRPSVE